jgi:hypothetical protein
VSASRKEIFTAPSVNTATDNLIVTAVNGLKRVDPDSRQTGTAASDVLYAVTRTGLKERSFELSDTVTLLYIETNNVNLQLINVSNNNFGTASTFALLRSGMF